MKRVFAIAVICLLEVGNAHAQAPNAQQLRRDEQLALLDVDAGLVVSLQLSQLGAAHRLAAQLAPQERQAMNLAALGAGAILGFNPLSTKAWTASGFDIRTPMVVQVAAASSDDALLRTRVVLATRTGSTANLSIEKMRLADKARPQAKRDSLAALFSSIPGTPKEDVLRQTLSAAGVFLVGRPRPLAGLLFAQRRGNFIILDLFDPKTIDFPTTLALLERKPHALHSRMPGAEALVKGPVGIWLRATELGRALERSVPGNAKRRRACSALASLGQKSSIEALGARLAINPKKVALELSWHMRHHTDVLGSLETRTSSLLQGNGLLDAQVYLARWDRIRDRKRPAEAQSWDTLWARNKLCGQASRIYTLATAWPDVLGLFLKEVSIIHPDAAVAIGSLGPTSAQIGKREKGALTFIAEGWIRDPGAALAKRWLELLFGSEQVRGTHVLWGKGAMRPYAIDQGGGSIIGAGFRPGSRRGALAAKRATKPQDPANQILASMAAKPAKLARLAPTLTGISWWAAWKRATATLSKRAHKVELSISLDR